MARTERAIWTAMLPLLMLSTILSSSLGDDESSSDALENFTDIFNEVKSEFANSSSEWHDTGKKEMVVKRISELVRNAWLLQKISAENGSNAAGDDVHQGAAKIFKAYDFAMSQPGKDNTKGAIFKASFDDAVNSVEAKLEALRDSGIDFTPTEKELKESQKIVIIEEYEPLKTAIVPTKELKEAEPFTEFVCMLNEINSEFTSPKSEWHKRANRESVLKTLGIFNNRARLIQANLTKAGMKTGEINLPHCTMDISNSFKKTFRRAGKESSRRPEFQDDLKRCVKALRGQLGKLKSLGMAPADLNLNATSKK